MASLNQVSIELQVTGEREATQALKRYTDAGDKLSRSVLNAAGKIENTTNAWDRANRLFEKGVLNTKSLRAAQTQLARELAVVNGYVKSNGALNTQKALAELRAAQATRDAAAAEAEKTAQMQRVSQSYNQLRAAIDPAYAARMRLKKAADTLRAAERQGLITRQQAIEQLRLYRDAAQQAAAGGGFMGRSVSRYGVLTQQAGYQVGDFIVQVQSGTNAFIAFGQQATQIAGTLTLLGGRYIALGTALGVTIPLLTALGAGLMRANVEADAIYEKFGFLEGSVRGLASAFGGVGGVIVNIVMTIVQNLDVFVSILGVAAVAAAVKFIAATSAMGTVMTSLALMFTTTGGAALVAASATTALTAAMARLMAVISAHPIIAAMTAALALAVVVLYRARDASDGFRSNVEGLSEALKELRDNAKEAGIEAARIELGADTDAQAIAMQRILEIREQISEQEQIAQRRGGHDRRNAENRIKELTLEREEIERLIEADRKRVRAMQRGVAQSNLESIISSYDEQYALQLKIKDAEDQLTQAFDLGLITQERMVEIMDEYRASLSQAAGTAEEFLEHQKGINDLLEAGVEAENARNRAYLDMMREKRNEMTMQGVINQHGQDSVEVAIERARQEAIAARLTVEQRDNYIAAAIEAYNLANSTEAQVMSLSTAIDIVERMAGTDLSGVFDRAATAVDGLNTKLGVTLSNVSRVMGRISAAALATVGTQAQVEALQGGASESEAAIAGELAMERARIGSTENIATNMTMLALEKTLQDQAAADAALRAEQDKLRPTSTGSTASARPTITEDEYLAQLRQEVDQKRRLSTLSEEQRSIEERVIQLQEQAQAKQLTISNERLRMFAMEEQRIADQMRLQDVFSSNIESALMSVVQGTQSVEDAFKGMLRNIILEIYKQQVASPIAEGAGSFLSSLFFANGGAFNRGNVIPFANGGVVGSPTTFPMANGNTGLMGEAGPEAIMPLKRGKDGKLGVATDGGGAVTVNNYFTVQANGDDSVKRIVRQQIPQIAEATKAAVVDSKRRGGSYGRAFG